jgi:hypothetical protein
MRYNIFQITDDLCILLRNDALFDNLLAEESNFSVINAVLDVRSEARFI